MSNQVTVYTPELSTKIPLFSVVIPAYNASAFVAECIESVLAQTDPDFEVIVVDDGSTDNTSKIVTSFTDSRLTLIQRTNGGLAAARNTGIAGAKGTFVAFLDADDRWLPEKLASHRHVLDAHPEASVSYDWAAFINAEGVLTGLYMAQTRRAITHEALMIKNYLGNGSTSVVRRSVLESFNGFDEQLFRLVDRELWVRLTYYGHTLQLVPKVLTEYRQHSSSFTSDTTRMLQGLEEFFQRIKLYAPESVSKFALLATASMHRWMARAAFVAQDYNRARYHARQSLASSIQIVWKDPRAPITFLAILIQSTLPKPMLDKLLNLATHVTTKWFQLRTNF